MSRLASRRKGPVPVTPNIVERTFAWLHHFTRLRGSMKARGGRAPDYDRQSTNFEAK